MNSLKILSLASLLIVSSSFAGNHEGSELKGTDNVHGVEVNVSKAVALIIPTEENSVNGVVYFSKVDGGIEVSGRIEGLTPGKHGFHVHQYGDITGSDGKSTGGHFNPLNKPHSGPHAKMRHIGDLGNIVADEKGIAEFQFVDKKLSFGGLTSIIGRGLIVHAGEDDLSSQPTGAAGARVGMGVIGIAE